MIVSNNTTFPPNFQGDKTTKFAGSDGCAMIHLQTLLICLGGKAKDKANCVRLCLYIYFILQII